MQQLYTPREVASHLKVGYRKVLDEISLGRLEALQIGNAYRISESAILKYQDSNKV